MNELFEGTRGFLLGFLAALISTLIVLGGFILALTEGGTRLALLPSPTAGLSPTVTVTSSPTSLPIVPPGAPTFTPSLIPTSTQVPTLTSSALSVSNDCSATPSGWVRISVPLGETLDSLADHYGIDAGDLAEANCLPPDLSGTLLADTDIYVPPPTPTATSQATTTPTTAQISCADRRPTSWIPYRVKRGENLFRIGLRYGVEATLLQYYNCIADPDRIVAGQIIYVPNVPTIMPISTATLTSAPTDTPVSTATPTPTNTSIPPTTAVTPISTAIPTDTPVPSATFTVTPTGVPPTETATVPPPTPTVSPPPPTTTVTSLPTPLISPIVTPPPGP